MNVKFANGEVPIWKLRKGTVVKYEYDYFYIKNMHVDFDSNIILLIQNGSLGNERVCTEDVTWLEPF